MRRPRSGRGISGCRAGGACGGCTGRSSGGCWRITKTGRLTGSSSMILTRLVRLTMAWRQCVPAARMAVEVGNLEPGGQPVLVTEMTPGAGQRGDDVQSPPAVIQGACGVLDDGEVITSLVDHL